MTAAMTMTTRMLRAAAIPTLSLALASCLPHGRTQSPEPAYALPERFADPADRESAGRETTDRPAAARPSHGAASERADARWWRQYDDATLHDLIERSLATNISLRARWAALEQARALAEQAHAARWPTISAQGAFNYSRSVGFFGTNNALQAQATLPIQWEIDLFRRYRGLGEAADLEADANRLEIEALAISTSAQVADAWYALVEANARHQLLAEQYRLNETYLELVQLRFQQGLSSALDVHQQRQLVAGARARLELVDSERELLRQQIAVLLGEIPSELAALPPTAEFPALGEAPAPGVPASVVWARPDVRAAQERVRAADWRVGSAIAARLPSIRLNASPGYTWSRNEIQGSAFGGGEPVVVSGFTFATGATLTVPIFDGFVGRGAVRQQRAALQSQVETLSQAVVTALVEVEGAIVREAQQRRNVELLGDQLTITHDTLEAARDRYRAGLSDYLPVLTALQSEQATEVELLAAQRQLVAGRVQLHRALGGAFPEELLARTRTPLSDGDNEP